MCAGSKSLVHMFHVSVVLPYVESTFLCGESNQLYSIKKKSRTVSTSKKPPKKASNPVPEASNSRDIRIFFVNSRSGKSVRGSISFHVDPSGNVKKSSSKIKFRVD